MDRRSFTAHLLSLLTAIPVVSKLSLLSGPASIWDGPAMPVASQSFGPVPTEVVSVWNPSMIPGCRSYYCVSCGVDEVPHSCENPQVSFIVYDRKLGKNEADQVREHVVHERMIRADLT